MQLATDKMIAMKEGAIGWMVYNHEARRNALSLEMQEAVPAVLEAFDRDPEVRVIVIRGAGETAFISGADVSEFESKRSTESGRDRFDATFSRAAAAMAKVGKPLVAMIHGFCIGGGLATALSADIRIAADDAQFGIPAARLGLGYRFSGIKALVDVVGPAYASEILFSGRRFSAEEALGMGLVNRVVAKADLEEAVREYLLR